MKLSSRSLANLQGVHPQLVDVVQRAIQITAQDFAVLQSVRTQAEQADKYAQGRTKPGPVVTWTLHSKHIPGADGYSHAVDIVPYPVDWNTPAKFDAVAKAMLTAADQLGYVIRWGADWDRDGKPREKGETDSPHFEWVGPSLSKSPTLSSVSS